MLLDPGLVVKRAQDKGKEFYESKSWSMCPGSKRSDNRLKRDLMCYPFFFLSFFLLIFIGTQRIPKYASHRKIIDMFFKLLTWEIPRELYG